MTLKKNAMIPNISISEESCFNKPHQEGYLVKLFNASGLERSKVESSKNQSKNSSKNYHQINHKI